jgi:hypothetical protein
MIEPRGNVGADSKLASLEGNDPDFACLCLLILDNLVKPFLCGI